MAANNNNPYGRGYSNLPPQLPQYQHPGYVNPPMVGVPMQQQAPVYPPQQQYQMPAQHLPPTQGYVPGIPMQMQQQYPGYSTLPPHQPIHYQQQYQQQYAQQQQQYQSQMNQLNARTNQMHTASALPASQFDGPAEGVPRPRTKSGTYAAESRAPSNASAHPASYESNDIPMQIPRPRPQHQPSPMMPGSASIRPPSTGSRPRSNTPRQQQPINAARPSPVNSRPTSSAPVPPASSKATTGRSSKPDLPLDYQQLLLALADEYITKARGMTAMLVRNMREADVEQYHKLIASGLGCMESVLTNFKFPKPKTEARLVHRYCSLLFEETENDDIAHEILSKTVKMCERNRLVDLRYSLIHLQLRFHFRSKPAVALRMLDQLIPNIEAYKHTSWVYAMRFLRVTMSLQLPQPDTSAALQQLRSISTLAQKNGHRPLMVTSSAIETLVHLQSDSSEAVQSAQRALASARMYQLDPSLSKIPQLTALIDCLDLCCDLISLSPSQALPKMQQMQKIMDDASLNTLWRSDGSFCVPVGEVVEAVIPVKEDTGGIFERAGDGQKAMAFTWIRRSELFSLGYLFSGIASAHKNSVNRRAERYLEEGSKICTDKYQPADEQGLQSLKAACAQDERRSYFHQSMLLYQVLVRCNRSDWSPAQRALEPFIQRLSPTAREATTEPLELLTIYLSGLIKQGTGDLRGALENFQCPVLKLQPAHSHKQTGNIHQELRLLSTLNSVLILRTDPNQHANIQSILPHLEPLCHDHPDKSFAAAYNLVVVASAVPALPVLRTKHLLSTGMELAKKVSSTHLMCVIMILMNATFFRDIVGEHAKKSATVGQTLAGKCGNQLWYAVASGMLARTNEVCGMKEDMVAANGEAVRAMGMLHAGLREKFH